MSRNESGKPPLSLEFFLEGVKETSEQAVGAAQRILALLDSDRRKIEALGRPAASALRVFQQAQTSPIFSIQSAAKRAGVSFPTASQAVAHMQKLGILREITRKRRHRLFVYKAYMTILNEGTEPLA
jgi:Fic family protein